MIEYDKSIFARNLQNYMAATETKQTDVCKLLGVSKSTVSAWCAAQKMPRMDKIEVLANYFGIMKSDLIEDSAGAPTPPSAKKEALVNDEDIKFALFGRTDIDDAVMEDVRRFARFAAMDEKEKGNDKSK